MNVTEANATNLLLRYVLGLPSLNQCGDGATQFNNDAGEAVLLLAERARKALGAGLNLDDVRDAWNRLELAGWWCDDCDAGWDECVRTRLQRAR
jgi:hypothetical protein